MNNMISLVKKKTCTRLHSRLVVGPIFPKQENGGFSLSAIDQSKGKYLQLDFGLLFFL